VATTPGGRVLIVSANLQTAFSDPPPPPAQVAAFARRVASILPYAPDAILLQEVDRPGATRVASSLSERLGLSYVVGAPPNDPVMDTSSATEDIVGDTSIVLNDTTMTALEPSTTVTTRYRLDDASTLIKRRTKQHVCLVAGERSGSLKVAMTSVHFAPDDRFASTTMGFCYKGQWTQKLTRFLAGRWPPPTHIHVVGGDFNNRRCVDKKETVRGETWPFWYALTSKWHYLDAIFSVHGGTNATLREQYRKGSGFAKTRIDYIFTSGGVIDASHDITYEAGRGDPDFYSDHRLVWSLIEAPVTSSSTR
jgi:endonuclease/exonuclease/phosphatase family metal-dependent hydrolase